MLHYKPDGASATFRGGSVPHIWPPHDDRNHSYLPDNNVYQTRFHETTDLVLTYDIRDMILFSQVERIVNFIELCGHGLELLYSVRSNDGRLLQSPELNV